MPISAQIRPLGRRKVGLALSGGAARGWAHIGALRALRRLGVDFDILAGCSAGALVGGCYLARKIDELEAWALALNKRKLFRYIDLNLNRGGLIRGDRLFADLQGLLGSLRIEELRMPFVAVATDLMTGHEVWLQTGDLTDVLRASSALPGLFPPVELDKRWLADGALVDLIAGLGYQKGFGGHFHNDNSIAVLRDIPGLIVACPSTGADAALMLRECVRLAREEQRVIVFLEPIALYPMRDLHADKDGLWMCRYPAGSQGVAFGEVGVYGAGKDLAIVTYGNGHYLSRQAEQALRERGVDLRIIDLRWLSPLPEAALLEAADGCRRVLIVDECRRSGNLSEALMALFVERKRIPAARIAAQDSFIATGPAYAATLPSKDDIFAAAIRSVEVS